MCGNGHNHATQTFSLEYVFSLQQKFSLRNAIWQFRNFDFSGFKMTFANSLIKKSLFITIFRSSYNALLFDQVYFVEVIDSIWFWHQLLTSAVILHLNFLHGKKGYTISFELKMSQNPSTAFRKTLTKFYQTK